MRWNWCKERWCSEVLCLLLFLLLLLVCLCLYCRLIGTEGSCVRNKPYLDSVCRNRGTSRLNGLPCIPLPELPLPEYLIHIYINFQYGISMDYIQLSMYLNVHSSARLITVPQCHPQEPCARVEFYAILLNHPLKETIPISKGILKCLCRRRFGQFNWRSILFPFTECEGLICCSKMNLEDMCWVYHHRLLMNQTITTLTRDE